MKIPEDKPSSTILKLIADDKNSVSYRPSFARLTGSATAAILLQQIVYWWSIKGCEPFFKFKEPCKHKAYKPGDSWCEELALSRAEFDNAFDKICTKVGKGQTSASVINFLMPRKEDFAGDDLAFGHALIIAVQHMVVVWRDGDNKTWYQVNTKLFTELIELLYDATEANAGILLSLANARNSRYLGKVKSSRSLGNVRNSLYPITETTQETTHNTSQPTPEAPKPKPPKAAAAPKEIVPAPDVALIEAYHYSLPEDIRPSKPAFSRYRELARTMIKGGLTAYDVVRYVVAESTAYQTWAIQRGAKPAMSLDHVDQEIRGWLKVHSSKPRAEPAIRYVPVERDEYVAPAEAV